MSKNRQAPGDIKPDPLAPFADLELTFEGSEKFGCRWTHNGLQLDFSSAKASSKWQDKQPITQTALGFASAELALVASRTMHVLFIKSPIHVKPDTSIKYLPKIIYFLDHKICYSAPPMRLVSQEE